MIGEKYYLEESDFNVPLSYQVSCLFTEILFVAFIVILIVFEQLFIIQVIILEGVSWLVVLKIPIANKFREWNEGVRSLFEFNLWVGFPHKITFYSL